MCSARAHSYERGPVAIFSEISHSANSSWLQCLVKNMPTSSCRSLMPAAANLVHPASPAVEKGEQEVVDSRRLETKDQTSRDNGSVRPKTQQCMYRCPA